MKAGNTEHDVGARVRITHITDPEDAPDLVGKTGEITHPFPGLMMPGVRYTVGLRLDDGQNANLCHGDRFEVIVPAAWSRLLAAAKVAEENWRHDPEGNLTAREHAKAHDELQQAILAAETLLAAPKEDR